MEITQHLNGTDARETGGDAPIFAKKRALQRAIVASHKRPSAVLFTGQHQAQNRLASCTLARLKRIERVIREHRCTRCFQHTFEVDRDCGERTAEKHKEQDCRERASKCSVQSEGALHEVRTRSR